jgi:hypothetical protein
MRRPGIVLRVTSWQCAQAIWARALPGNGFSDLTQAAGNISAIAAASGHTFAIVRVFILTSPMREANRGEAPPVAVGPRGIIIARRGFSKLSRFAHRVLFHR